MLVLNFNQFLKMVQIVRMCYGQEFSVKFLEWGLEQNGVDLENVYDTIQVTSKSQAKGL